MEQRKGLGRGLASLIRPAVFPKEPSLNQPAVSLSNPSLVAFPQGPGSVMMPLALIRENPHQPRKDFDDEKLKELAASISEKGILCPLLIRREGQAHSTGSPQAGSGQGYHLIAGERRLRASRLAGLKEVPVLIRETTEKETMELALIENIQRQDLNPLEEATAYQELIEQFQQTQEEVAQKVGRDRATVANLLRLLKLPEKVRTYLRSGKISMGHARALLTVPQIERQIYFCDKVVSEGWSVRELEAALHAGQLSARTRSAGRGVTLAPGLNSLVDTLRRRLGTQVKLVSSGKKGKIVIEYYSQDDLNRLYNLIVT